MVILFVYIRPFAGMKFAQWRKMLTKVGSNFCPILNKHSHNCPRLLKYCQTGEISPNLVTLITDCLPAYLPVPIKMLQKNTLPTIFPHLCIYFEGNFKLHISRLLQYVCLKARSDLCNSDVFTQ